MGTDRRTVTVTADVSRHNSWRDARDDAMLALLAAHVRRLIQDDHLFADWAEANNVTIEVGY